MTSAVVHASGLKDSLQPRNDSVQDDSGARTRLIQQVGGESLDAVRGDLRPHDGILPGHCLADFSNEILARRRICSVE